LEVNEKFCPVCKNKNERDAVSCKYCGALLSPPSGNSYSTTVNTGGFEKGGSKLPDSLIDEALIPEGGIAIYVGGASKPTYLNFNENLVLGRKKENITDDSLFDLTELGGYQMGLSRRHAMIRRTEHGFELVDLSSTNGTWLNNEKLVPYKPYPLKSGAEVRLGRLRLLIIYHPTTLQEKKAK
jgi:hypothetical protein